MIHKPTLFPEVKLIDTPVFCDDRGQLTIGFQLSAFRELTGYLGEWVQDIETHSYQGVLRGLHYQCPKAQGKCLRVTRGQIIDVVVDMRVWSPHFGRWASYELSEASPQALWIPPGFAHGYLVRSAHATVSYKLTAYRFAAFEKNLLWNDSSLNIDWQYPHSPILSARDQLAPDWQMATKYHTPEDLL
ncbi:MAG: dTDP-4-dehydrorhamnose 3,5-epimerase [Gammaproteobacteria bacterium]|nr:dTDP-4-dehydrorhamnose 3,5-epimerase [Gammaproteobacteria bacterium]